MLAGRTEAKGLTPVHYLTGPQEIRKQLADLFAALCVCTRKGLVNHVSAYDGLEHFAPIRSEQQPADTFVLRIRNTLKKPLLFEERNALRGRALGAAQVLGHSGKGIAVAVRLLQEAQDLDVNILQAEFIGRTPELGIEQ